MHAASLVAPPRSGRIERPLCIGFLLRRRSFRHAAGHGYAGSIHFAVGARRSLQTTDRSEGMGVAYLRVSVTDRCDLRCAYCMPMRSAGAPRSEILTYEEIVQVIEVLVGLGIRKVRLTGGEPLQRPGIEGLLREVARVRGIRDLGLTTNGTRLGEFIPLLARAGYRVNVHLDTLDPDRYRARMGGRNPFIVCDAIREAVRAGILVKINAVCSADTTLEDAVGLIAFGREVGATVRLIEAMPVSGLDEDRGARETMRTLEERLTDLLQLRRVERDGVAWMRVGSRGERVGFIVPSHKRFCDGCDKVRLSAKGRLRSCLFGPEGTDLRPDLRTHDWQSLRSKAAAVLAQKRTGGGREGRRIETMFGIGG